MRAVKFAGAVAIVVSFLSITLPLRYFFQGPSLRRKRLKVAAFFFRRLLQLLGIRVDYQGLRPYLLPGHLVVANHLSYLDVFVMGGRFPAVFVTSEETRSHWLLGPICRGAGALFVERRNARSLTVEIPLIAQCLRENFTVVLYPEATTSDGGRMLPFRASLFKAAEDAPADVVPFCINYLAVEDQPVTGARRQQVVYHGDTTFLGHFWRLLSARTVRVRLEQLEVLFPDQFRSRRELSDAAHQMIQKAYVPRT